MLITLLLQPSADLRIGAEPDKTQVLAKAGRPLAAMADMGADSIDEE